MKTYKDDGGGITERSLAFWRYNIDNIGHAPFIIEASYEPVAWDYLDNVMIEYNLSIAGSKGCVLLSGCNCGYGGEGPNGTRQILEYYGVSPEQARELMLRKHFSIKINVEVEVA
jgi:hypothetical protein